MSFSKNSPASAPQKQESLPLMALQQSHSTPLPLEAHNNATAVTDLMEQEPPDAKLTQSRDRTKRVTVWTNHFLDGASMEIFASLFNFWSETLR